MDYKNGVIDSIEENGKMKLSIQYENDINAVIIYGTKNDGNLFAVSRILPVRPEKDKRKFAAEIGKEVESVINEHVDFWFDRKED